MRASGLLTISAAALLLPLAGVGDGTADANGFGPYTLRIDDLGPSYRQTAAHRESNAWVIKHGTPPTIVHRYGRVGGYEREFRKRGSDLSGLLNIDSHVAATRTAAGSHGAFLYLSEHPTKPKAGVRFHPVAVPRVGDESRCYYTDLQKSGISVRLFYCHWRHGRLIGQLLATGLNPQRLLPALERTLGQQERRMASFRAAVHLSPVPRGASRVASKEARSAHGSGGFTSLLPPPSGKAYFGFTFRLWDTSDPIQGDARGFTERIRDSIQFELAGKKPTFLKVYAAWQNPEALGKPLIPFSASNDDVAKVRAITGAHSLLNLDWTIVNTTAQNGGVTVKNIASGALDGYIRGYARELKNFGDPVLIRLFGGEFNGSWSYGQSPRANPNLTPADFAAAWRRVVDIFRQTGALNVSFAWIANAYPPSPVSWVDPDIAAYYPGDAYVDWIGADIEDFSAPAWLDPIYAFAVAHTKPFFLAEFGLRFDGSTLTPAEDQAWLGTMFDYFESHNDIKAISYFNYNSRPDHGIPWDTSRAVYLYGGLVNYLANVNDDDQRLLAESGADFRGTFSRRIANARYVSSILTQHFAPPVKCLVPKVKNKPLAVAKRAILARHCRVGRIRRAYKKTVKKGRVISEKPKPGTVLPSGSKVDLIVSSGSTRAGRAASRTPRLTIREP